MVRTMKKSLIEETLPIRELNRDAAIEMAYKAIPAYIKHCKELKIPKKKIKRQFYDPKIRNLHPWFARRPCSIARAITLASVISDNVAKKDFLKAIGWDGKPGAFLTEGYPPLLFYTDPDHKLISKLVNEFLNKNLSEVTVCDPMAGGGTIPLESLRLGFRSIAIEYNPVAYLILKGTIEYPALYGDELVARVKDESKKLIDYARSKLGKFYPEDAEGYIIARGIHCPHCEGHIPLLHSTEITKSTYLKLTFDNSAKRFKAYIVKAPTRLPYQRRGKIQCPYCRTLISKEEAYKLWTKNHIAILKNMQNGKFDENEILSTHVLLIKQTKSGYAIVNEEDITSFLNAGKALAENFGEIKKFIPAAEIPKENEVFAPMREYGITRWYELFNPRQLLVLGALIKYVNERCDQLIKEGDLGAAICLYLALGISRVIDYNSIATTWKRGTIRDTIGRYAQGRKITYGGEYCEAIVPYRNLNWIYETYSKKKTEGGIVPILGELCKRTFNSSKRVTIIHGDCRYLSSMTTFKPVDVINVDPPYFDQHIYSDISEYFWQVLRKALEPLIDRGIIFKKSYVRDWTPKESTVPRTGEIIARKSSIQKASKGRIAFSPEWYTRQMATFFKECYKVLNDDGVLLTWFTHRSLEAWKSIIAALYAGGFYITKIWPVTSELLTRLVSKQNNLTLNRTLIIVARKRMDRNLERYKLERHVKHLMKEMAEILMEIGASPSELNVFLKAAAMCAVTRTPRSQEIKDPIRYCDGKLIPLSLTIAERFLQPILDEFKKRTQYESKLENFI